MIRKSSSIALKAVLGILFAAFITIGCNSSGEDKKEAADSTATQAPAAADSAAKSMDTASTKPVVTPN